MLATIGGQHRQNLRGMAEYLNAFKVLMPLADFALYASGNSPKMRPIYPCKNHANPWAQDK